MNYENERVSEVQLPPWLHAIQRMGIMAPEEAQGIFARLAMLPIDRVMGFLEADEFLRANRNLLWLDVHEQLPFDEPWEVLLNNPRRSAAKIFGGQARVWQDFEVAERVVVFPGINTPTKIPLIVKPDMVPLGLTERDDQLNGYSPIVHWATRSRYAQSGIEVANVVLDELQYRQLQQGDPLTIVTDAYNYGARPFVLKQGSHPGGLYSFDGVPRLLGFDLVNRIGKQIQIDGKEGKDWTWIFHPSWPRNYLHIVGIRIQIGNWQTPITNRAGEISIRDSGEGYRDEIAGLLEPADFGKMLPAVHVQHGPFGNIDEYRMYLESLARRDTKEPLRSIFLITETPQIRLSDGVSAVVGSYPNTYAYQLNALKIEGAKGMIERTNWPVRTEINVAIFGGMCILPAYINLYFFQER
ncbi:hypothetical protein HY409_04275 [Candidatus Gottesmanbacteria bacterium]|nr:hypothetical protein [Candidatus Gottesmanbacteria bacterium]